MVIAKHLRGRPYLLYFYAALFGAATQLVSSLLGDPIHAYLENVSGLHASHFDPAQHPVRWLLSMPEFWIGLLAMAILVKLTLGIPKFRRRTTKQETLETPADHEVQAKSGLPAARQAHTTNEVQVQRDAPAKSPAPPKREVQAKREAPTDHKVNAEQKRRISRRLSRALAPEASETEAAIDVDLLFRAALRAAEATGGISPPELLADFEDLTGLTAPDWAGGIEEIHARAVVDDDMEVFDKVTSLLDRQIIMALVLKIGSIDGQLPPRTKILVDTLAGRLHLGPEEVTELFDAVNAEDDTAAA